jgi:hypothetical protein
LDRSSIFISAALRLFTYAVWDRVALPQFPGYLVEPPLSPLRTRLGNQGLKQVIVMCSGVIAQEA